MVPSPCKLSMVTEVVEAVDLTTHYKSWFAC